MECTCGSNCGLSMPSSLSVFGGIISVIGGWVMWGVREEWWECEEGFVEFLFLHYGTIHFSRSDNNNNQIPQRINQCVYQILTIFNVSSNIGLSSSSN